MLAWLSENLINIVLITVMALVVGLVIRGMIRSKKSGSCSCCGDCSHCAGCGSSCQKP